MQGAGGHCRARSRLRLAALLVFFALFPTQAGAVATITLQQRVGGGGNVSPVVLPTIQGGSLQTYVLVISTRHDGDVIAVSGGGLVWTEQVEQCGAKLDVAIRLWTAQGSPGGPFQVQISFADGDNLAALLARYSGVDSFEDPTGQNTNGENGICADGPKNRLAQITLTSTAEGSVHLTSVNPQDKNVVSFSPGYSLVGNHALNDTKAVVFHRTFSVPTTDTFQANLDGDKKWAAAGIVLNPLECLDDPDCTDGNLCNGTETCVAGACVAGTPLNCNDGNVCTVDTCDAALGCLNTPVPNGAGCEDGDACTTGDACISGVCTAGAPLNCNDSNQCTTDSCDPVSGCQNVPVANGTSCEDGNLCTEGDTCQAGSCAAGAPPDCDDGEFCTVDSCNPGTGCVNAPRPNGTPCDDGNACTTVDECSLGTCVGGGAPLDCDDGNVCTVDGCDPALGCQNAALPNGTPCVDGDVCNGAESCQAGICSAGAPLDCNDGDPCTADSCNALLGCQNPIVADGTSCADGNLCNGAETCQAGTCTPGAPLSCNDGEFCTTDSCDPVLGCQHSPLTDGTPCDDGDSCTTVDECTAGVCVGGGSPFNCNDSDPCTADSCDPVLGCQNVPLPDGTPCADGDLCNGAETCQAGSCTAGAPPDCDDGEPCTADSCDPVLGCQNTPVANGTSCTDGDVCNGDESCQGGVCGAGTPLDCDDGELCTTDSCDTVLGCLNTPLADGTSCADGDACNGDETCQVGTCTAGPPLDCSDGDPCTADSCNPLLGCQNPPVADGTSCADADLCNGEETCQGGICAPGIPPDCSDGDVCTTDSCDPILGCQNVAAVDGTGCDDGDLCTAIDECLSGVCTGTGALDCDDANPCTADSCDPVLGCQSTPVTDGISCSDGDVCDGAEVCQAGLCIEGTPLDCSDANPCTADGCDAALGCQNPPLADGASCVDANLCNGAETCQSGICTAGPPLDCNDGNPCTANGCDPVLGCQNPPVGDGASCVDGDVCNGAETCQSGTCTAGPSLDCDDQNVCTVDTCDAVLGCLNSPGLDGLPCEDGNACTINDSCVSGACLGGGFQSCDDGNACTQDSCDPVLGCASTPGPDGVSCDDGDACTTSDSCFGGICNGGPPPDCNDGDVCTVDSCDPVLGCSNAAVADGTGCDDGDPCTTVDECQSGVCVGGGSAFNCDDGNPCTVDSCDPVLGCSNDPIGDGGACDDGEFCTTGETCTAGICGGGAPTDCSGLDDTCNQGSCDEIADSCVAQPVNEGGSCEDGNLCNGAETCQAGVCASGTPPDCDDANVCTADSCDPALGCQNTSVPNGISCSDGDVCNGAETCQGGACTAGAALDCDDGNPCTADSCDPALACQNAALPAGTDCSDGDLCNGDEVCQGGVCTAGTPLSCNDGNVCTTDTCDTLLGCQNDAVANGTACPDGTLCNGAETCQAGVCTAGAPLDCDDSNSCTVDTCNATLGCTNTPGLNGTACNDGDACTTGDTCISGLCLGGAPPSCGDGNPCTTDSCDPVVGCQNIALADGTACDDGDLCTDGDTCQAGSCTAGPALDCNDGEFCTVDICSPLLGCRNLSRPNGTPCDDADACTTVDECSGGICVGGGSPFNCDDSNACTTDLCDPVLGCTNDPVAEGTACDDGEFCTTGDTCTAGTCGGGGLRDCSAFSDQCNVGLCDEVGDTCFAQPSNEGGACDDGEFCTTGDSCTAGVCDGSGATDCSFLNGPCVQGICDEAGDLCVTQAANEGGACNDSDACTTGDSCVSGVCVGGAPPNCNDGNVCTTDSCDPALGCQSAPVGDGIPCADGNLCNGGETCQAGVCTAGPALDCSDGNVCTVDACDPVLGCINSPVPNGAACNDGNACTTNDACISGTCAGGAPANCNDGNVCTTDSCDPLVGCQSAAVADGSPCADANLCNGDETCQAGTCVAGAALDCNDDEFCTVDSCNPATGCQHAQRPNGTPCDDGDACTTVDECSLGICIGGGSPFNCNDGNPCTTDICDPVLGCSNDAVADGTSCNDGQFCTTGDSCTTGVCGGGPTDCSGAGDQCNSGVCDEVADACVPQPTNEGLGCDDGQFCTTGEACTTGVCGGGAATDCSSLDDQCLQGVCNETADACEAQPANEGGTCDDADECTSGDSCASGICVGGAPPDCDDGNICTTDTCDPVLGCQSVAVVDGTPCLDGTVCNGAESCQGGTCTAGTPLDCNDGNVCTVDTCSAVSGCQNNPVPDGAACSDGNACTTADSCVSGVCAGGAPPNCNDGNQCTADSCNPALGCQNTNLADGTACNDANACTTSDACQTGVCTGGPAPDCNDGNHCTVDSCSPAVGCQNAASPNGTPCNDGNPCTTVDECVLGSCFGGGAPLDCTDGNPCTADTCDAVLGCQNPPVADGTSCSDGQFCTQSTTCTSGICGGGTPINCSGLDDQCNVGVCNEALDVCEAQPANQGSACDDGQFCTTGEICNSGVCGAGAATDCSSLDDQCLQGICNETADACQAQPANEGGACDDGDACTTGDACSSGACVGGGSPFDCDDGNPCTADSCDPVAGCSNVPVADGTSCNDGTVCNGAETCQAGTCSAGTPLDCNDGNVCTVDTCNAVSGCRNNPVPDGAACNDGNACTTADSCVTGICTGGAPPNCNDGNACTADSCDPALGCQNNPVANGTACDDEDACTNGDTCQTGSCTPGAPLDCDDGFFCTVDSCNSETGCQNAPRPNGTPCDDGNLCTTVDECVLGACVGGGTPLDCNDSNPCTTDACNPVAGCQNNPVANGTSCNDGQFCTQSTTCTSGVCGGGTPINCSGLDDQCLQGVCDEGADTCVPQPANEGAACNDGQFCTTGEICTAGACGSGSPTDCSSLDDQCLQGVCNETADACQAQPANGGSACNDGDACTTGDSCASGVCVGGAPPNCNDGNVCTADSCDSVLGCQHSAVADGTACPDGTVCNGAETCQLGVCNAGTPLDCNDGNQCSVDTCDAVLGCRNTNVQDGVSCNDSNACTTNDSCISGTCIGGAPPDCNDGNQCTADSCDSALGCRNINLADGSACNDADACTTADSCQAGLCTGGPPPDCDDGEFCTVDSCNSALGCQSAPRPNGTPCDDGDGCTTVDECVLGACVGGGSPFDCNDDNPCTTDLCDPVLGCSYQNLADGTSCEDGEFCTVGDICIGGACDGATRNCSAAADQCNTGACDEGADSCVPQPANEGLACDDAQFCTTGETCAAGLCAGGAATDCSSLDDQCLQGVCNETADACQAQSANEGGACDDSDACTTADACVSGVCTGGAPPDCDDGNVCTTDTCDPALGCQSAPVANGTACLDGTVCNGTETCQAGTCTAGTPLDCNDGNQCTVDTCDAALGCQNTNKANGTSCNDADACTTADSCISGVCTGGPSLDCNDGNQCTADSCDTVLGCQNINLANGTACNDANACTTSDTCQAGACTGGPAPNCDDGEFCTVDSCDTLLGCQYSFRPEGTPCDDGDACTTVDECSTGVCIGGGSPFDCNDDNPCTVDLCDPVLGCSYQDEANGTSCEDGDFCTVGDTCTSGVCDGPPRDCSAAGDQCNTGVCNEALDTCLPQPSNEGLACDDTQFCTTGETCSSGVCGPGAPTDCSSLDDQCLQGVCNETADACQAQPANEGGACNDSDACTTADACVSGVCTGGAPPDCDDGNVCTTDTCDSLLGCQHSAVADGTSCPDSTVCNGAETCQAGTCTAGTPPDCNDGLQCTVDTCDAVLGCQNTNKANGTSCNDADACTTADSCISGVCTGGPSLDCNDGEQCTADSCDTVLGCQNINLANGTACNDANACTTSDTCQAGACTGGPAPNCDDGEFCTVDSCDSLLGCQHSFRPEGTPCDDADACTTVDECSAGVCIGGGSPFNCNDGNPCTADTCDPVLGCSYQDVADGTSCEDGDFCTVGDTCTAGLCGGSARDCSAAGDQCNNGVCNEALDSCVPQPANEGAACDDTQFCTTGETCSSGVCGPGAPTDCSSLDDQCLQGVCNETADACQAQPANQGGACDDANACTTADTCVSGVCIGGAPPDCDDGNVCTIDTCDPVLGCQTAPVVNGTPCLDGTVCNGAETCQAGTCTAGTPLDCNDSNVCTVDTCSALLGCQNNAVPDGATCNDSNACTTADACVSGICTGGPPAACGDGNECTTDSCDPALGCQNDPVIDGTACDDGNECSDGDACQAGLCLGGPAPDCDDGNQCTVDSCSATLGCQNAPLPNGTACNDGNPCTTVDECSLGSCIGGGAVLNCDDANPCTADSCDPGLGCAYSPVADGTACDDNQFCTTGESCASGICTNGAATDCSTLDDQCNLGVCDEGNNTCVAQPTSEGGACDDGQFCTTGETCTSGACGGGGPTDCSALNDQCNQGVCNETLNVCQVQATNEGGSCDDADACTTADSCAAGACVGGPPPDCNDANVCTNDTCDSAIGCQNLPVTDGLPCPDGLLCNGDETCQSGVCAPGSVPDCDDGQQCTVDTCDDALGCKHTPVPDGFSCEDGNACSDGDVCVSGICLSGAAPDCDDSNQCTTDSCDPVSGCQNAAVLDGTTCDDRNECSDGDACQAGLCVGGPAPDCDDGNPCTLDTCSVLLGCQSAQFPNDTPCDDGNLCTTVDVCTLGICIGGGARLTCNDSNPCTDDSCIDFVSCSNVPNTDPCNDGLFCTTGEVCAAGACGGGAPLDCSTEDDQCNLGACDEVVDACVPQPANEGAGCDDSLFCTMDETCSGGVCGNGSPLDCSFLDDQCSQGTCDEDADTCMAQPTNEGLACDDGQFCTSAETCVSGVCGAASPTNCSALNDQCNLGVCDEDADTCLAQPANEGLGCDDDLFCTSGEICSGGACGGGGATDCSAFDDQCNQGSCDEVGDACFAQPINEGLPCDDASACTLADTCQAGACVGGAPPDCDDLNECTVDTCNVASGCVHAPVPDGNLCEDGSACTTPDKCISGICISGPPPDCNDDNQCTNDSCDPLTGCLHPAVTDGSSCEDGNVCTESDTCQAGACTPGPAPDCDDGNSCTVDGCLLGLGCRNAPIPDGAPCDDANFCTTIDLCSLGICTGGGPPLVCDDVNICTDDSCEAATGCVFAPNTEPCEDGDFCTENDLCAAGSCTAGTPVVCDDLNVCTDDTCDPATGCTFTDNQAPCDDANACTANDFCDVGVCNAGSPVVCDDFESCTTDSCDPAIGCQFIARADSTPCSDGDACTIGEQCQAATCVGGQPVSCDDGNSCTIDSCNSLVGCRFQLVNCSDGDPCTVDTCHPITGCHSVLDIDSDVDGFPNSCDPCPFDAFNDLDNDEICGDEDNCPAVGNSDQLDADRDGIGNLCDPDRVYVAFGSSCSLNCSCGTAADPFATVDAALACAPYPGSQNKQARAVILTPGSHPPFTLTKRAHVQPEDPNQFTTIQGTSFGPAVDVPSNGTLYGLTIEGGSPGILVRDSSPLVRGCDITFNFASQTDPNDPDADSGGGMRVIRGSPTLEDNRFTLNLATGCGGALYLSESAALLRRNEFRQNSAFAGGAICAVESAPRSQGDWIEDNTASSDGGGIYLDRSAGLFEEGIISGNSVALTTGRGGGVFLLGSAPIFKNQRISDNQAALGGGVYMIASGGEITRSRLLDNFATADGGALEIVTPSSAVKLTSAFLAGNSAGREGGALHCPSGVAPVHVVNDTLSANQAFVAGSAVSVGDCALTFRNNIVVDQVGAPALGCENTDSVQIGYNDFFGNAGDLGVGCASAGPLFTLDPGFQGCPGDFHLPAGSPVIDRGLNAADGLPSMDIDGDLRVLDGNADFDFVVDLGADELQCGDTDNDGVDRCAGDCDDHDAKVFPGALELCDGKDNDCNCIVDDDTDVDGDTFTVCGGDCNDSDPMVNPGAGEICDGLDNNCNDFIDEGFDVDGDSYTSCGGDCDDSDPDTSPDGIEVCDLADNNCDTLLDNDQDGDTFGPCGGDCDESDPAINPLAAEICDGIDNNCNTLIDEGCP